MLQEPEACIPTTGGEGRIAGGGTRGTGEAAGGWGRGLRILLRRKNISTIASVCCPALDLSGLEKFPLKDAGIYWAGRRVE